MKDEGELGANQCGNTNATPGTMYELLDPSRIRLSQDFESQIGVKKALITVPVRRPDKQSWIRVHPDESWHIDTAVLEVKEDRETFIVDRGLWPELAREITPKRLFTAITRQDVIFLWPVRLPGPDGRLDEWNRSAHAAAEIAISSWVRLSANMSLGAYEVSVASADLPEPVWPEGDFRRLLDVAFKGKYICTLDHPVIRKLRGEI
jgi:hypothetical protein